MVCLVLAFSRPELLQNLLKAIRKGHWGGGTIYFYVDKYIYIHIEGERERKREKERERERKREKERERERKREKERERERKREKERERERERETDVFVDVNMALYVDKLFLSGCLRFQTVTPHAERLILTNMYIPLSGTLYFRL